MTMASDERDRLLDNLRRLHLRHAAAHLDDHLQQAAQLKLGHVGVIARMMEAEVLARAETGARKRIAAADFPELKRLEDYDFKRQPSLDRKQVLDLAELGFLDACQCVFWLGPSGVGKTHLAIGLGVRACQAGYRVRHFRAFDLFKRLWAALADDSLDELLDEVCEPHLLILDDVTRSPRRDEQDFAAVFNELVHRRHRRGSIVITSNLGFDEWGPALGTSAMVIPALDRLLEAAHVFVFPRDAKSFRPERTDPPGPLPPPKKRRGARSLPAARPPRRR
jgi:DNA replication protein DnaC